MDPFENTNIIQKPFLCLSYTIAEFLYQQSYGLPLIESAESEVFAK